MGAAKHSSACCSALVHAECDMYRHTGRTTGKGKQQVSRNPPQVRV
jgi:hypothetical protein